MLTLLKKFFKTERIAVDVIIIYLYKKIYHSQLFNLMNSKKSKILFIVGCQRSGTSLMNRIFTRNLNASVYRESSRLSSKDPYKLRLNCYEEIDKELKKNKASFIVIKPLVETQNILQLLEYFPDAKALWMYRNYKDFIQSNIKRFHKNAAINALKAIIERDPNDWRSEKVSEQVHSIVTKHYKQTISIYDASALFWFARNQLFYDLALDSNPRVFICRYEDLVEYPEEMVGEIYDFIDVKCPKRKNFLREINTHAIGKGNTVNLSQSIEELCEELLKKMNDTYFSHYPTFKEKHISNQG